MAAPTPTARQTPTGLRLTDGHSTKITFARSPAISLWEITVKPPGIDGGDEIDTTTMHNVLWRTRQPRQLRTLTESTFTAAYDPNVYNTILSNLNVNDQITCRFPDGSTLAFWGYLKAFEVNDHTEGEQPEATVTIVPTNQDDDGAEQAPVMTSVSGT